MGKGKIINLKIEGMEYPNKGIGVYEGTRVEVKNAIKGQTVSAGIKKKSGRYEGRLLEVIEKSCLETEAMCTDFGMCGGCAYQNIPYEEELHLKEEGVLKLFNDQEIDGFEYLGILPAPDYMGYRNKMEFSFGDFTKGGQLELGMRKRNSYYEVVTSRNCNIIDDDFKKILLCTLEFFRDTGEKFHHKITKEGTLRHLVIRKAFFTGEIMVNLVTTSGLKDFDVGSALSQRYVDGLKNLNTKGEITGILHTCCDSCADVVIPDKLDILYGRDYITEKLLGLSFKITPFSFFQTNSAGAENLYGIVRDFVGEGNPGNVFDLYSGTGTIGQIVSKTEAMAKNGGKVYGIELVEEAVNAAMENCRINNIDNCRFIAGDVLTKVNELEVRPDLIILDPPRSGVHPKALNKIIGFKAETIVYVSCNPASLVRDLKEFEGGGYVVRKVRICDMFPRTWHVECVVLMTRLQNGRIFYMEYRMVQQIAKDTIEYIQKLIKPGMNLDTIKSLCEAKMIELGADSFWYWDIGAFCFSGNETAISLSGREYQISDRIISNDDIITIDLSPQKNNIWGDYARTLIIENGRIISNVNDISNTEWKNGLLMEDKLHLEMTRFVTPTTTFEELHYHINSYIAKAGYINLDFMGNLGHSIEKIKDARIYIEKGNKTTLSEVSMFTFEPHISISESLYGYKKEDIYYFEDGSLQRQ